jgi:murein DD-endopeptidase MepM/ murein hydrolase activator NlpD
MRACRALAVCFLSAFAAALPAFATATGDVLVRLEDEDGRYLVWADNRLAGPVEVMLHAGQGVVGEPELPARATVPAHSSVLVARVHRDGSAGGGLGLRLDTIPGSVNAAPRDYEYLFPLSSPAPRIEQGWGGRYSHGDAENHHAVDFAADDGTTVVAAREGIVMQVDASETAAGEGRRDDDANFVRILHDDGSMAVYAHLQPAGALVQHGQRVRRGQPIGLSGNSGFSSGPHLHFVVQANRGMHLESIPFRMFSNQGILRFSEPAPDAAD